MVGFGAADEVKITPQSPTKGTRLTPPGPWDCCDGQISAACRDTNLDYYSFRSAGHVFLDPDCESILVSADLKLNSGKRGRLYYGAGAVVLRLRSHTARQRLPKGRPMRGSLFLSIYIRQGGTGSAHLPITCRMGQRNAAKRRRGLKSRWRDHQFNCPPALHQPSRVEDRAGICRLPWRIVARRRQLKS